jgi:hypothetical protein
MKATVPQGTLVPIKDCWIEIDGDRITMKILPDISDSKSAEYTDESGIGRSMPFKSYQNSSNRTISWTVHFVVCKDGDQETIMENLRLIESAVYPKASNTGGAPYAPPPLCTLRCGELLSEGESEDICAVLKSYSVKFDTSVPWDEIGYVPYKMDVDLSFEVVYDQSALPGSEKIMDDGV